MPHRGVQQPVQVAHWRRGGGGEGGEEWEERGGEGREMRMGVSLYMKNEVVASNKEGMWQRS